MTEPNRPPVEVRQVAVRQVAQATRWFAAGLAILFAWTAASLLIFMQVRFDKLDQQPIQGVMFAGAQLRIELGTYRLWLNQALLTREAADREAASLAYDILLSRLGMIESKSGFRLPSHDLKLLENYEGVSREIKSWEPLMVAFEAGDDAKGRAILERLSEYSIEFAMLSTLINDYAYEWFVSNADSVYSFFTFLAGAMLAAVALMAFLLRSLFTSARAAERAYDELHAAHQELFEAKNAAEKSDRVKSQFLANVSHELRTPLNAIIGFSEILADKSIALKSEAKKDEYLGYVLSSGRHLLSLINDILDFSKIQQGHWDPVFEPLDLRGALSGIVRTMSAVASGRRVKLTERLDAEIPTIETDERAFRQVLLNVLSNAVKFSPPEGEVTVEMRAQGAEVVVEIDDEGPGIDQDFLKRVGAPFSQARSSAYSGEAGTGLGLAITKELLSRIGGAFKIENRPEGGARVTLIFRPGPPPVE